VKHVQKFKVTKNSSASWNRSGRTFFHHKLILYWVCAVKSILDHRFQRERAAAQVHSLSACQMWDFYFSWISKFPESRKQFVNFTETPENSRKSIHKLDFPNRKNFLILEVF